MATTTDEATPERGAPWQYGEHLAPRLGHVIDLGTIADGATPTAYQARAVPTIKGEYFSGSEGVVYVLQRRAAAGGRWQLAPDAYGSARNSLGERHMYITQERAVGEFVLIAHRAAARGAAVAMSPAAAAQEAAMVAEAERYAAGAEARERARAVAPLAMVLEEGRLLLAVRDPLRQGGGPFYVALTYGAIGATPEENDRRRLDDARLSALLGQIGRLATAEQVADDARFRLADLDPAGD